MSDYLKVSVLALSLLATVNSHGLSLLTDIIGHIQPDIGQSGCPKDTMVDAGNVVVCYRERLATEPLEYKLLSQEQLPDIKRQSWQLISQAWSPGEMVQPAQWEHTVDLFIPDKALSQRALVVVNNGINHNTDQAASVGPTDFTTIALAEIARATNTIVISVSNIPNQYLMYHNDGKPRREDDSVARSWALFLDAPEQQLTTPLHIPMAAAISQAMTLAQRELTPWNIKSFIVSGVSKRGWATWLSAITDSRIEAIVPFVIDLLGTVESLKHMYQSYGGNWPIAFYPYYREHIDEKINTAAFSRLMQISDPLQYRDSVYEPRLRIAKYIINASGDDFYVPDNTQFYYDKLPGQKVLRVTPNSSHYGISAFTGQSLITFINRIQRSVTMPDISVSLHSQGNLQKLTARFSQQPTQIMLWKAINPLARDFRYACGIRYSSSPLSLAATGEVEVLLNNPVAGWQAAFIEATFSDGFVATTPVYVSPADRYPTSAPPSDEAACKTLPGRW